MLFIIRVKRELNIEMGVGIMRDVDTWYTLLFIMKRWNQSYSSHTGCLLWIDKARANDKTLLLFIIRVKWELKRVYRENASHTLGCVGKHTVSLVLVVSQQETVVLVRLSRNQSTWVHVIVRNVGVGRVLCACVSEYHRDGEGADWRELSRLWYTLVVMP